jgi:D-sedoheptulose 7-phosphate isomerase
MDRDQKLSWIRKEAKEASVLRRTVSEELGQQIVDMADVISGVFGSGGKLLTAGNGGSAAEASHFAAELVVRLTSKRTRPALPALSLNTDQSVMTAAANDFDFDKVFARQVEGLGSKGDMLLVISTSGNSANLVEAVRTARDRGLITAGLLGSDGGHLGSIVDKPLIVPHSSVQRIQEEHTFIVHVLVELIEGVLFV